MDKFTQAYIECALWSSTYETPDREDNPMDDGVHDLAPDAIKQMQIDCDNFRESNIELLRGIDEEQAGHDFWLTRNGHGAGFWDRGLGEVGTKLTDAAHAYGECDLYVGDDGLIYIS